MIKRIFIVLSLSLCYLSGAAQAHENKKWHIGVKAIPAYSNNTMSYTAGIQVRRKLFRSFDISSGIFYSNYNAKGNPYYIYNEGGNIVHKRKESMFSINYINLPLMLRYNFFKNFHCALGLVYDFYLSNRFYTKEFDISKTFGNMKKIVPEFRLSSGYKFNLSDKYALETEVSLSAMAVYHNLDYDFYHPLLHRAGLGITLYRNFNVNNKKEK